MIRWIIFILAFTSLIYGQATTPFVTTFPVTENPLSQNSFWIEGGTTGLQWHNCAATPAFSFGTQPGTIQFDDSTCVLSGSWRTNQIASIKIKRTGSVHAIVEEAEVRLRSTITANNNTGYEINCSVTGTNNYVQIVRWNGALGAFTQLGPSSNTPCVDGDVLTATIIGSIITAYVNGTQLLQQSDTTYTTGSPGMGFYIEQCGANCALANQDFGAYSFFAGDGVNLAATCSRADVNAVINGPTHIAVNNDTIIIPSGSCTLTSGITINGVGITIMGLGKPNTNGVSTGAGTSATTLAIAPNNSFFAFSGLSFGQTARVSNLNLNSSNTGTVGGTRDFPVQFYGTCTSSGCANVRMDNITFGTNNWNNNLSNGGFVGADNVFGVLDHNTANESGASGTGGVGTPFVQLAYSAWAGVGNFGDKSFAAADSFGTGQSMYLENNSLNFVRGTENDVATADGFQGAPRYVCRFNTVLNMSGTGLCSGHGTGWLGRLRGQRQIEVYYNSVTTVAANGCDSVTGISSGTGRFFSNSITTSSVGCNEFVRVDIARFIQNTSPWNSCDGTQPWDQTPFTSASICMDQPGRGGLGALLQNTTPVLASSPGIPCTTPGQCYPAAPLVPIYEAGDTSTVANVSQGINGVSGAGHINANVDYYGEVSQTAQTSASSPFSGATGTGYGTLARRPTTCTTGVGYWATDTGTWNVSGSASNGTFYICTGTNTWTSSYAPYVYPHPLISGAVVTSASPSVSLSPTTLIFTPLPVGNTSPSQPVVLTNNGAGTLNITSITPSGDFGQSNNCSATLAPSSSCTINVFFSPSVIGTRTGTITLIDDASDSPQSVPLTGSGITLIARLRGHVTFRKNSSAFLGSGTTPGAPLIYSARTDQCGSSGTGTDTGCTGQPAMTFFGRNTSVGQAYTPTDVPPLLNNGNPLTGQNLCATDPDFHTKVCRVTDYTAMNSLGSGFNTGSGGDVQNWAADESGYIVYTAGGGQPIVVAFTPGVMTSTASQVGSIVGASDCAGGVYFGTNCKSFVTGNISYSPSDGSVIYEMDLNFAPTHLYLNKLTLNKSGIPSTWTFSRALLFDFASSTHCMPADFTASYVGSFNISSDSTVFAFAFGDNGQNGQRDFTITGSITSGSFIKNEVLIQTSTGATTVVDTCGAVACTSPFAIRAYTGSPDNSHTWVGQSSSAIFTPTGLPVLQHYGASFLGMYNTGHAGCRVLKTFGPGHDGFGPMTIDGDWGPTGNVLMGTNQQATTCNAANTGQSPNCYPNTTPVGTSQGPTLLDTMELHNAGPTANNLYLVFSGSDIQSCTTVGGRPTCYCAGSNLCESYTWEGVTLNIRPNLPEGHNVKGTLGAYKGTNYAYFTYHDPYIKLNNLLTVSIPVDQHGTPTNLNSLDQQPIAFSSAQACGTATGPGNQSCDASYGIISGVTGNYPYYDEFDMVQNQAVYGAAAQFCNYGSGPNSTACVYRMAHTFNSGTNWNFSTQNAIGNISPDGHYAMVGTDWFATGSATDGLNRGFGCTNGWDGITSGTRCLPNLDANGNGTLYSTSASKTGSTITFISTNMVPTVGAKLTVKGFTTETRYNGTFTVATSPGSGIWTASSTATVFASDSGGTANWDCGNGALASTPCPRGDVVVINLFTAGTVH